jgi:hypothetical protein
MAYIHKIAIIDLLGDFYNFNSEENYFSCNFYGKNWCTILTVIVY